MRDSNYVLQYLEETYPNKLPIKQVSDFELGKLLGVQELIDNLKIKLKRTHQQEQEVK